VGQSLTRGAAPGFPVVPMRASLPLLFAAAVLLVGLVPSAGATLGDPLIGVNFTAGCDALVADTAGQTCPRAPSPAAVADGLCPRALDGGRACDRVGRAEAVACGVASQGAAEAGRLYGPGQAHWGSCRVAEVGASAFDDACGVAGAAQRKSMSIVFVDRADAGAACADPGGAASEACTAAWAWEAKEAPGGVAVDPAVCTTVGGAVGGAAQRMNTGTVKFFNEK